WRSDRIRYALTMLYLAFAGFVGTSLALAVDVTLGNRLVALPTALAVIGVLLMLGSCVNLVREAMEALRSNRLEVAFFRQLHALRDSAGGCASVVAEFPPSGSESPGDGRAPASTKSAP